MRSRAQWLMCTTGPKCLRFIAAVSADGSEIMTVRPKPAQSIPHTAFPVRPARQRFLRPDFVVQMVSPSCNRYATLTIGDEFGRLVATAFSVTAPTAAELDRPPLLFAVTTTRKLVSFDLTTGHHVILVRTPSPHTIAHDPGQSLRMCVAGLHVGCTASETRLC